MADYSIRVKGKTIYCGHWHTSWGHSKLHKFGPEWNDPYSTNPEHRRAHFEPFYDDGICAMDACTAYSHKVNVIAVDIEKIDDLVKEMVGDAE